MTDFKGFVAKQGLKMDLPRQPMIREAWLLAMILNVLDKNGMIC